jgi:hypothetical protein
VNAESADLSRLVSVERRTTPGGDAPGDQTLARFELFFRQGDLSVELNAADGEPLSWVYPKLAEGNAAPSDAASALAAAEQAAALPPGAVLVHADFEIMNGRRVFVAHWEHREQGLPVERDYIQVLVSGQTGRVFAVHRRWHSVNFSPSER